MTTHVQPAYSEVSLLTIPNVRVRLRFAAVPIILSENGTEILMLEFHPTIGERERGKLMIPLERRDWRAIRTNLLNLNCSDLDSVCKWLSSAGYVPEAILELPLFTRPNVQQRAPFFSARDVERMAAGNLGWRTELVTPGIRQWLEKHRDVFGWMLQLEKRRFREAIKAAHEYKAEQDETDRTREIAIVFEQKNLRLKDPAVTFLKRLRAPNFDAGVLGLALRGTSVSEGLPVRLSWDSEGFPLVEARCNSPREALCVSIHIDQNFSQRRPVKCPCGKWLDPIRGRDRFCSKRCRNFYLTSARRKKISLVKQAAQDWETLPAHKKANRDSAEWIANLVNRTTSGEHTIEPSWVRKVLDPCEPKKQRASAQHKQVPTAKAATTKGRAADRAGRK